MKKRILALFLSVVMMLSLAACGASPASKDPTPAPDAEPAPAADAAAQPVPVSAVSELSDIDAQLHMIQFHMDEMQQSGAQPWYYAVTDLDHDGNLEFVAASQHTIDRSLNLKVWEVTPDRSALKECGVSKDEDESFPDIMTDATDTFHDTATDTWSYLFYDNVALSPTEVYTSKSAFHMKDDVIAYEAYAIEHTIVENGARTVSYTNAEGDEITQDDYNAAGINAFSGAARSSTNFEWLTADEAKGIVRLTDSYAVFMGVKKASESFPVPAPEAFAAPMATPTPAPTEAPATPEPTKAPETPKPTKAPATPKPTKAPATPTPTPVPTYIPDPEPMYLDITKNPTNEPGKREGETALFVASANVYDYLTWTLVSPQGYDYTPDQFARQFPTVSISGYYGTTLCLSNLTFDVGGWGAYCTFFYRGQSARTTTAYVYVTLKPAPVPTPDPVVPDGGVYYGNVADWNYSTVTINLDGTTFVAIPWDVCDLRGDIYSGAPATAYWSGTTTKGLNFTYVEIQGEEHMLGPVYGSMSGWAYEGGGGYAIDLVNGTQVFVDAWNCTVSGNFYEGCSCTVYYTNYPSNENIYRAEIYGSNDYEFQGGWAGSQYYANEAAFGAFDPYYIDQGTYGYETGNYYGGFPTHVSYNSDGSTYEAIWCPDCGAEISMAREYCPVCGRRI